MYSCPVDPVPTCNVPFTPRVKVGAPTVRVRGVVALAEPEVPFSVAVYCPAGTVLEAVSVKVLLYVVGFGENAAVTPLGRPEIEKLTLPLNPFCPWTYT